MLSGYIPTLVLFHTIVCFILARELSKQATREIIGHCIDGRQAGLSMDLFYCMYSIHMQNITIFSLYITRQNSYFDAAHSMTHYLQTSALSIRTESRYGRGATSHVARFSDGCL